MSSHRPLTLDDFHSARERIQGFAICTPLIQVETDARDDIYLKLENLQPIGAFKIRGAASKLNTVSPDLLQEGVWTASAGNMAQGVAWCARALGIPFTAVVPETAPQAKIGAIERLGGKVVRVTREQFFDIFATREYPGLNGLFVHAFSDPDVMAGNGTIGLEILDDLPDVATVYIPYGGGGLSCGIASALRAKGSTAQVRACEPETAAPLAAALAAGQAVTVPFEPSFVDGAGSPRVYDEMLELARDLITASVPVPAERTAASVRLIAERTHTIAEGAGGLGLAAALLEHEPGPIVCVVSGGNMNPAALNQILTGSVPGP